MRKHFSARCPERSAHGNFLESCGPFCQDEISDIRTRNKEYEANRAHQEPEIPDPFRWEEIILERFDAGAITGIGFRMVFGDTPGDNAHLTLRLLQGHAGFQASHRKQPMEIVIDHLRPKRQRYDQLRREAVGGAGRCYADHCVRLAIYA